MLEFFRHITPKAKILFVAFILVLIPGAIISYLSLQSIKQQADNLRVEFSGTVSLVRDKLENEISRLEVNLRNSATELSIPESDEASLLKLWLREIESENPAFKNLFVINTNEGLISSSVSLSWNMQQGYQNSVSPGASVSFHMAEKAEFTDRNYLVSIELYREALASSISAQESALLMSRIGRCYIKQGNYNKAIEEYNKILELGRDDLTIGNVPASIVALSQIADCYEAMKSSVEHYQALIELYRHLLDQPWDLASGEYLYYLNTVSERINKLEVSLIDNNDAERNIGSLMMREDSLLEHISYIRFLDQNILPELESNIRYGAPGELQSLDFLQKDYDPKFQLGFFKLPEAFQQAELWALGYQYDKDYILSSLFPETLDSVELGKDVFICILDEKDSVLYAQQDQPISLYLVAENLSQTFTDWKAALFDPDGRSIEQITVREGRLYLILFTGIIFVMLIGIVVMVRAIIHESEISRMKSEFVSNVSHELKTPLALIRMFGETLDSGIVTDEKERLKFYSIIRKESERLTHLINNVLDFSRMDAGIKEYNFQETDLVEVVRNSLEAYKFQLSDNGFTIESDLPGETIVLKIDRDAISQVLINLLNNAVKYSDEQKYILVKVDRNSTSAMVSVKDQGIGISKEELKKIFDKFYRVSSARTKEKRGSGLGLTLARHIVEAHGGTIEVNSEIGEGSKFTVRIPLP